MEQGYEINNKMYPKITFLGETSLYDDHQPVK